MLSFLLLSTAGLFVTVSSHSVHTLWSCNKNNSISELSNGNCVKTSKRDRRKRGCSGINNLSKQEASSSNNFIEIDTADKVWVLFSTARDGALTAKRGANTPTTAEHRGRGQFRRMRSGPIMHNINFEVGHCESLEALNPTPQTGPIDNGDIRGNKKRRALAVRGGGIGKASVKDWEQIKGDQSMKNHLHQIVKDQELECSLDKFFDLFIADNSRHSIGRYLESRGDFQLKETAWKKIKGANNELSRTIHYTHPVNMPMGPPTAVARKEQTYCRYGQYGISIGTKTFVEELPMADCFYVDDQILVEPIDDGKRITVTMKYGIVFLKSTIFKGVISKTTSSEMADYLNEMVSYMSRALGTTALNGKKNLFISIFGIIVNKVAVPLLLASLAIHFYHIFGEDVKRTMGGLYRRVTSAAMPLSGD